MYCFVWMLACRSKTIFGNWKPFRWWTCFSFNLKISFRSQNIQIFVLTFCTCRKMVESLSKCMTSQPWEQTVSMYILANTLRNKNNGTMPFGQLVEYNMGNIFLEKSYIKCRGTIPRSFPEKSILSVSLDQQRKVCFNCMSCWGLSKYFKTKLQTLAFTSYKVIFKNKRRSGNTLPASLSARVMKKIFILLYFINWPNVIVWLPLLREILSNKCSNYPVKSQC